MRILSEETPHDTGALSEAFPRKSFRRFFPGHRCFNVTSSRLHKADWFQNIQSYSCAKVPIPVAAVRICNWFCESVRTGEVDPLLAYFTDKMK